jgi:hypothetical protein
VTHDGARGARFVAGMIAALCAICGLAALFGVPAASAVFFGLGGILLGTAAARGILPRRDWGLTVRTILALVSVGGIFAGYHLSVIGFSTVRGVFLWGLYFGFWSVAVPRLTDPIPLERTGR